MIIKIKIFNEKVVTRVLEVKSFCVYAEGDNIYLDTKEEIPNDIYCFGSPIEIYTLGENGTVDIIRLSPNYTKA